MKELFYWVCCLWRGYHTDKPNYPRFIWQQVGLTETERISVHRCKCGATLPLLAPDTPCGMVTRWRTNNEFNPAVGMYVDCLTRMIESMSDDKFGIAGKA